MLGGNVNIICVVVGLFMLYVKWMQGVEDLMFEDDMFVGWNVLEFIDVKDLVNYICVVMFSLGVIEVVVQIMVKFFFKVFGIFVVIENIVISIIIMWDLGNLDFVFYYVIEYKFKSQDGLYQIKEDIIIMCYSIGGLSFNLEYEIWVLVVNFIGQGFFSEFVVICMGEQVLVSVL